VNLPNYTKFGHKKAAAVKRYTVTFTATEVRIKKSRDGRPPRDSLVNRQIEGGLYETPQSCQTHAQHQKDQNGRPRSAERRYALEKQCTSSKVFGLQAA